MSNRQQAHDIFAKHKHLADNPEQFKNTVINEIISVTGCGLRTANVFFNDALKSTPSIKGVKRIMVKKFTSPKTKESVESSEDEDSTCFTVIEVVNNAIHYTVSYSDRKEAEKQFNTKLKFWPDQDWLLIEGLGPNVGHEFRPHRNLTCTLMRNPKFQKQVDTVPA